MRVLALKSSLDAIASKIKEKTGISGTLLFPTGFESAINTLVKLATKTSGQSNAGQNQVLYGYSAWASDGSEIKGGYKTQDSKTVTAGTTQTTVSPDSGYNAMAEVKVNPLPNGSVDSVTLDQDLLNKYIKFSSASGTELASSSSVGNVTKTITAFKITALSGDIVRVHKGVIGPITDGTSLTIPSIPFSTILGCVVFQYDRGTYTNRNVLLAYAKSTTEFGTNSDLYYGGSYGSTSPGSSDPVARNLTGNYATFGSNSVTVEFPSSGDNRHLVRGSYAYVVWGR